MSSPLAQALSETDVVFHPAGPMLRSFKNVETELVVPWIETTRRLVQTAAATVRAKAAGLHRGTYILYQHLR
jgi:hypothetical protein